MNASGVLGVVMGVVVFAVMFLDPKELKSWLHPYSMARTTLSSVGRAIVCVMLNTWLVLGCVWTFGHCSDLCENTPLFKAASPYLTSWLVIGLLLAVIMVYLYLTAPKEAVVEMIADKPVDYGELYYPTESRQIQAMYYYPPRWVTSRDSSGRTVRVYYPPRWASSDGTEPRTGAEAPLGYLMNNSTSGAPPPQYSESMQPRPSPPTGFPPPLAPVPPRNQHVNWR